MKPVDREASTLDHADEDSPLGSALFFARVLALLKTRFD
jgi:hypothetical protein